MPSSLIFAGLVVLWLLILVPTVARHRQEVARPSTAALSGRVLERPRPGGAARRRIEEVDEMAEPDEFADGAQEVPAGDARDDEDRDDDARDDRARNDDARDDRARDAGARDGPGRGAGWETADEEEPSWDRPAPRYRPGRGGFDPAAAALAAKARYAFRQRVVFGLLAAAVITAAAAVFLSPPLWWVHGVVDLVLVTYLVYLRRQVRMESSIRERRAARMAGTRRPAAAEDPQLDEWARRGQEATARRARERDDADDDSDDSDHGPDRDAGPVARPGVTTSGGRIVRDLGIGIVGAGVGVGGDARADRAGWSGPGSGDGSRQQYGTAHEGTGHGGSGHGGSGHGGSSHDGTGHEGDDGSADASSPAGRTGASRRTDEGTGSTRAGGDPVEEASEEPALPRLRPAGPPPLPSGTAPLALEDLDPDLPAVDRHAPRYRRAAGQ